MANAQHDQNGIPTLNATSSVDGKTTVPMQANPTSHRLKTSEGSTGSDVSPDPSARRDENAVTSFTAVSSVDGVTPVPIYITSNLLLTKRT